MFIALLQLRHTLHTHASPYLFTVFVLLTWLVWLAKVVLSRRYRPWTEPYGTTTSVVIPVVDEPLDLFRDVLSRITAQEPTQVIVVINGPRNVGLEGVCEEFPDVEWTWTAVAGKRNAVRIGVERSIGDVLILVDSDTIWTPGTHDELIKPFRDPTIGGVTTKQRILQPNRCFLTRWADWMEDTRALYSMPAQSVLGTVGCLPGRTIAFRRAILEQVMPDFMGQRFLGVMLEVSDDRTLTNLTLKAGYRTVYQSTSLVYTDAPTRLRKMARQQYRWARGSQYNTLRMSGWMLRHTPVLGFFFVMDILLPYLWLCTLIALVIRSTLGYGEDLYAGLLHPNGRVNGIVAIAFLTLVMSALSMSLRQVRHLAVVPGDFLRMPLYIIFSTLVLMPIRLVGFLRLGHPASWGTRRAAYAGGASAGTASGSPEVTGSGRPDDGDPRALIPYLIAIAILLVGVLYDVHPS